MGLFLSRLTPVVLNNTARSPGDSGYLHIKTSWGSTDIVVRRLSPNVSKSCGHTCSTLDEQKSVKCNANQEEIQRGCMSFPGASGGVGAARCRSVSCVRTYNAVVSVGRLTESLISAATEWGQTDHTALSPYNLSMVDVECLSQQQQRSLSDAGYHLEGKSCIPYNLSINENFADNSSGETRNTKGTDGAVSAKCVYQCGYDALAVSMPS
jgi:hypothetical protein